MDLQTQKLNLIEEVLHLESSELVQQLVSFLQLLKHPPVNDDDIPVMPGRSAAEVQASLEQALREVDQGEVVSHAEVVALAQQWHPK